MTPDEFRAIRHKRGMTQTELASLVGKSPMMISRYERGEYPVKGSVVVLMRHIDTYGKGYL